MKRFFLSLMLVVTLARVSQGIILQWYIDNERGSPDYDYAQFVAVSGDTTLYSYLIKMDEAGQHEAGFPTNPWDVGPEGVHSESWSTMNLGDYMTRFEDGQTDPAIGADYNFTGYTFYCRMMDSNGLPIEGAVSSPAVVFPDDMRDFFFDAANVYPQTWIININPAAVP